MARILYLDSVAGVAGDMFAAAFLDAGIVTVEELNSLVPKLRLDGVIIRSEQVQRASVTATHLSVETENDQWKYRFSHTHRGGEGHHHEHRAHDSSTNLVLDGGEHHWHAAYTAVRSVIERSALEIGVRERSLEIFRVIAEAEATVHGLPVEYAVFHEIGTIDSIIDVVMASYCIEKVNSDSVVASPIRPGRGYIKISHGTHRVPAPASALLLRGMEVGKTPDAVTRENIELSTPTGIAIIRSLNPEFSHEMPLGKLVSNGRGAGSMDLGNFPNVFQLSLLESGSASTDLPYDNDLVYEITCNIDDDTAEHISWICEKLLEIGALDVWQTPATGKKGRSMIVLSALAAEGDLKRIADWILRNSTTFGLRYHRAERLKLASRFEAASENGSTMRYKIGMDIEGNEIKRKVEFEDWKRARSNT